MAKSLPKKIAGIPTPVVIVGGVAVVAYFYLRHSSVASGVSQAGQSTGTGGAGGGGFGARGPRGPRGPAGRRITRTIRKTVYICPKGYHRVVGKGCVRNAPPKKHPAAQHLARQRG